MTVLKSFKFSEDLFFQDETFLPLDKMDLALLVGNNRDGQTPGLSNGAGKTRLIQLLQAFIYGSCERGNFKKIVTPKFVGTLEFRTAMTVGSPPQDWSFTYDLAENRWMILMDGKHFSGSHKPSECQALLEKKIGYTQKEWNNFIHINGRSIATLLEGKPADRRKYLESYFNIDDWYAQKKKEYDELCAALEDDLNALQQKQSQLDQIVQLLNNQESEKYLEYQIEILESSIVHLKERLAALTSEVDKHTADISLWAEYQDLFQKVEGKTKLKILQEQRDDLSQKLADLREKQKRRQTLEIFVRTELDLARKALKPLEPEPTVDNPDVQSLMKREADLAQMRQKIKIKQKMRELEGILPDVSCIRLTDEKISTVLTGIREHRAEIKHHLALLKDGDTCPHCGQTLAFILQNAPAEQRERELSEELREIEQQITEFEGQAQSLQRFHTLSEQIVGLQKEFESYPVFGIKVSEAEAELGKLKAASAEWTAWYRVKNKHQEGQNLFDAKLAQATGMGYPDLLNEEFLDKIDNLKGSLKDVQDDIGVQEYFERIAEKVSQLQTKSTLTEALKKLREEQAQMQKDVDELSELKGQHRASLKSVSGLTDTRKSLEMELVRKIDLEREYAVMEGLVKFYSPKGFMLYELKRRCQALIDRANYWSPVFFQEQYEWSLSPDMDDLDFLVRPVNHKATDPYSVSLFSAGEKNRAARVLLFSQLQIQPPNKRINVLFLDEVEQNLDKAGMVAFTEVVIPKLKETFSDRSIVVISHDPSLQNSPSIDSLWTVEKKDRKSTLTIIDSRK